MTQGRAGRDRRHGRAVKRTTGRRRRAWTGRDGVDRRRAMGADEGRATADGGSDKLFRARGRRRPTEEAEAARSATGRACCSPPATGSTTDPRRGPRRRAQMALAGAARRRGWIRRNGRRTGWRRRIHDGQGLLLPSYERIDDGGRQMAPNEGKKGKAALCCCCDSITKKEWVWGWRMPPPGARRSSQGQCSGDDEGGGRVSMLCYNEGRKKTELCYCIERGPKGYIYKR